MNAFCSICSNELCEHVVHEVERLEKSLNKTVQFLKQLDQYFCERIIDPCGYNPELESIEELRITVRNNSTDNDIKLSKLRDLLKEIGEL
jgi:hypothetical protein